MANQRILQQLRDQIQVAAKADLGQDIAHEFGSPVELVQILLDEVTLDQGADKIAKRQQHRRGNRREKQRETKGDRPGPHYADSGTSST